VDVWIFWCADVRICG